MDLTGNTNLDPEEATTYNVGFVTDFGDDRWVATLDYYDFDFKNPIIAENHQQLMNAYAGGGASKAAVQSQIYGGTNLQNDGSFAASSVGRITANYVNGPATTVNGIDLYIKYEDDYANGVISAGLEANYVAKYSVCLLYTSPSPRDIGESRMPSSA